jgi:hypothetical protein
MNPENSKDLFPVRFPPEEIADYRHQNGPLMTILKCQLPDLTGKSRMMAPFITIEENNNGSRKTKH